MRKRILLSASVALALAFGASALHVVRGAGPADDPFVISADAPTKKGGKGFARAMKTPFKAIGRLFGRGGGGENRITRMTEKDARKFESVAVARVSDATTAHAAPAGAPTAEPPAAESPAADLLAQGREALSRGGLGEAVTLLTRAAALDPKLAEAHRLAGQAYARMGLHEQSGRSFKRAVDLMPKNAQVLNDYGYALFLAGDLEGAAKYLKRSARYNPSSQRVWNNLAVVQCRQEKFDDAYKSFARAVGEFAAHVNVAKMLVRAGRDGEAIRHYEQARRVGPPTPELLRSLAGLYDRAGRPAEAEEARRQMVTAAGGPAPTKGN